MNVQIRFISSLEKVFCDRPGLQVDELRSLSALKGETVSFQIVLAAQENEWVKISIDSDFADVTLREVGHVPGTVIATDPGYLRSGTALFPDPLLPMNGMVLVKKNCWTAVWVTIPVPTRCRAGLHRLNMTFRNSNTCHAEPENPWEIKKSFSITVKKSILPEQTLIHTEWMHSDCISQFYHVKPWSEEHWNLLEKYFSSAVSLGINVLYTPLWTPPLDTGFGSERPTTQLLEIRKRGRKYTFCFDNLKRWFALGLKCGFRYFDFSHFFTQWGAEYTPKIVAMVNGSETKIFGWHVRAESSEYDNFLKQLIPQLIELIHSLKLEKKVFFHVSDEPKLIQLESYQRGFRQIKKLIGDIPVLDALSDISFYLKGTAEIPIVACNHIEPFVEHKVKPLFTYYCCAQWENMPNRFFAMPSSRNRILGILLYLYDADGFLQWGFNFWFSNLSFRQDLIPFVITDCCGSFPSGDAFLVYPGMDGPIDSIRGMVMREALQDLRVLRKLEKKIGRKKVVSMLQNGRSEPITFADYPDDPNWILAVREKINDLL